ALDLAAAKRRQQAVRLNQSHTCLRQTNSVSVPKRKLTADEVRIVKNRIEPVCSIVRRILVALRPEDRSAKTQVVDIDRSLNRRHVRTNVHRPSGNWIPIVTPERVVVAVRQIQTAEVPITIHAD